MPKNIVICSDGTGNYDINGRGTNVFKLFEAVDLNGHRTDPQKTPQVALYDDGVGTQSLKPVKLISGAFGWGLSRNVKQLYTELVRAYEPGDSIFLFGFSRGAFTVRTLVGLITDCGILDQSKFANEAALQKAVEEAYDEHRKHYRTFWQELFASKKSSDPGSVFRQRKAAQSHPYDQTTIKFIGVWDTVDAVGLPVDELTDFINYFIYRFKFPDQHLHAKVEKACHALSVEDERRSFHPVLWAETEEDQRAPRIEQVWFPGVHSNVGGGYPKQGMSLVALDWMMTRAERVGLRFIPTVRALLCELQNVNDKLYDSRAGLGAYYRYQPRDIRQLCQKCNVTPQIHYSLIDRVVQGTGGYAPCTLPQKFQLVSDGMLNKEQKGEIIQLIGSHMGNHNSLLEQVSKWVSLRKICYYLFVGLSLFSIGVALWEHLKTQALPNGNVQDYVLGYGKLLWSIVTLVINPLSVLALLAKLSPHWLWLLMGLVLSFIAGQWANAKMKSELSDFWHSIALQLKSGILGKCKGSAEPVVQTNPQALSQ